MAPLITLTTYKNIVMVMLEESKQKLVSSLSPSAVFLFPAVGLISVLGMVMQNKLLS